MGSNKDVMKVLEHRKYLGCNVFLTSRPHNTRAIESRFDTVVSVEGFTRSEATKFAKCVVLDEEKVKQILDFNPAGGKQEVALCQCPILLSFICILVRDNALDLSDNTIPTGEIYTKMIQCLYKKFTIRRGIRYDDSEFAEVMRLVGKIAWETLLSGNPSFERSRVERDVGKDAFDYGFLIGHEGLISEPKADIWITFAHRSIQEFFGAFYLVLQLIEGRDIDDLPGPSHKHPVFMKNPLFLHFTFWLLSEKCNEDYFPLGKIDKACEILHPYIYSKIHRMLGSPQLTREFPAIDIERALDSKDRTNEKHFGRMLEQFKNIKFLVLGNEASRDWILDRILPTCHTLSFVVKDDLLHCVNPELVKFNGNSTNVLLSDEAYTAGVLKNLCKIAGQSHRGLAVYLFVTEQTIDLSEVLRREVQKLHIIGTARAGTDVTATVNLISCSFLTHLSVIGHVRPSQSLLPVISKAVTEGKLPRLQNLSFPGMNIEGQLKNLFEGRTVQTNLTHLNLCDCDLDKEDLEAFCFASKKGSFPNLMSLGLDYRNSSSGARLLRPAETNIFAQNWGNITSLSVKPLTKLGFRDLMKGIGQSKLTKLKKLCLLMMPNKTGNLREMREMRELPNLEHLSVQRCITSKRNFEQLSRMLIHWTLHTLDISHSRGITGELSELTSQNLASLRNLILHDCQLNVRDMMSLSEANDKGRLSKLENLDLSDNSYLNVHCFPFGSRWFNLKKLKINNERDEFSSSLEVDDLTGYLSVKELRISQRDLLHIRYGHWEHIERLDIVMSRDERALLSPLLTNYVEKGYLPSLQTLCFLSHDTKLGEYNDFTKLSQKGIVICVVDPDEEKMMIDADLTEQF